MSFSAFGHWAFVAGILLAIIAGFSEIPYLVPVLFALGLVVGILNVEEKESTSFLVAVTALLVIGLAGLQASSWSATGATILNNFLAFVAAAGLVVAIKEVLFAAKNHD